ncbi:TauD/TfdA family dioxygenase [Actinomadura rubrisoli]|uniref:TauD/TfdA family dioxygenase n=1 Tax=Actinomadura rubrisoli TaxID=2530368 RepID=A0A4V2YYW9_9ACTN|nr:TauD/TfdA family dioxygenase [Actinomadura rubrisoli]TDD94817.1 TauD/TfdA family dioxygenase [Actinomadura rubrisoli]
MAQALPFVVEAEGPDLTKLIEHDRPRLRGLLREHGAILFRGFPIGGVDGFQPVVEALSGEPPLEYAERSSPRSAIKGNVYTSTDYPPDEEIFLHNESSYQLSWPRFLYFCCVRPPETQGATPLADSRLILRSVDPAVREEFDRRGWMVVRNFQAPFGIPWQQAFNTDDRSAVEEYCRDHGIEYEWRGDDHLRTRAVRKTTHRHPETGAEVWFNHATFFHHTTLPTDVREGLLAVLDVEDLPTNTYFGDGGAIPPATLDHLRSCYRSNTVRFDWRQDDILVIDNMLTAHAREPYTGPRRIAVAMAEPYEPSV